MGGNLDRQHGFDGRYNSSNIADIKGREFGLVVCSGIQSAMWLANRDPDEDMRRISSLFETLSAVRAETFVLVSTIAVYRHPVAGFYEDTGRFEDKTAYGRNRRAAETMAMEMFKRCLIVRLPALFGPGLKKNFLFDLMNREPRMIMPEKFADLLSRADASGRAALQSSYSPGANGVQNLRAELDDKARAGLMSVLESLGFTSLVFTHAQSRFQFYNLEHLWEDIRRALNAGLGSLNLATPPVSAHDIAQRFYSLDFSNETAQPPYDYNMKTRHASLRGLEGDYLYSLDEVVSELGAFLKVKA